MENNSENTKWSRGGFRGGRGIGRGAKVAGRGKIINNSTDDTGQVDKTTKVSRNPGQVKKVRKPKFSAGGGFNKVANKNKDFDNTNAIVVQKKSGFDFSRLGPANTSETDKVSLDSGVNHPQNVFQNKNKNHRFMKNQTSKATYKDLDAINQDIEEAEDDDQDMESDDINEFESDDMEGEQEMVEEDEDALMGEEEAIMEEDMVEEEEREFGDFEEEAQLPKINTIVPQGGSVLSASMRANRKTKEQRKMEEEERLKNIEKFKKLKEERERKKQEYIKAGKMSEQNKQYSLEDAINLVPECEEMCPEYEKKTRLWNNQVDPLEEYPDFMVKKFSRSSAGKGEELPNEIRTPEALETSLNYLINDVLGSGKHSFYDVHAFLRDRMIAIRVDFTKQLYVNVLPTAASAYERITRFHILSIHEMAKIKKDDQVPLDRQEFIRALGNLFKFYDALRKEGVKCENEKEFRCYNELNNLITIHKEFHIRDGKTKPISQSDSFEANLINKLKTKIRSIKSLSENQELTNKEHVMDVFKEFFELCFSINKEHFLYACIMETHFQSIRKYLLKSFYILASQSDVSFPLEMLHFDNREYALEYLERYGVSTVIDNGVEMVYFPQNSKIKKTIDDSKIDPVNLKVIYSTNIEQIKDGLKYTEIVNGPYIPKIKSPISLLGNNKNATTNSFSRFNANLLPAGTFSSVQNNQIGSVTGYGFYPNPTPLARGTFNPAVLASSTMNSSPLASSTFNAQSQTSALMQKTILNSTAPKVQNNQGESNQSLNINNDLNPDAQNISNGQALGNVEQKEIIDTNVHENQLATTIKGKEEKVKEIQRLKEESRADEQILIRAQQERESLRVKKEKMIMQKEIEEQEMLKWIQQVRNEFQKKIQLEGQEIWNQAEALRSEYNKELLKEQKKANAIKKKRRQQQIDKLIEDLTNQIIDEYTENKINKIVTQKLETIDIDEALFNDIQYECIQDLVAKKMAINHRKTYLKKFCFQNMKLYSESKRQQKIRTIERIEKINNMKPSSRQDYRPYNTYYENENEFNWNDYIESAEDLSLDQKMTKLVEKSREAHRLKVSPILTTDVIYTVLCQLIVPEIMHPFVDQICWNTYFISNDVENEVSSYLQTKLSLEKLNDNIYNAGYFQNNINEFKKIEWNLNLANNFKAFKPLKQEKCFTFSTLVYQLDFFDSNQTYEEYFELQLIKLQGNLQSAPNTLFNNLGLIYWPVSTNDIITKEMINDKLILNKDKIQNTFNKVNILVMEPYDLDEQLKNFIYQLAMDTNIPKPEKMTIYRDTIQCFETGMYKLIHHLSTSKDLINSERFFDFLNIGIIRLNLIIQLLKVNDLGELDLFLDRNKDSYTFPNFINEDKNIEEHIKCLLEYHKQRFNIVGDNFAAPLKHYLTILSNKLFQNLKEYSIQQPINFDFIKVKFKESIQAGIRYIDTEFIPTDNNNNTELTPRQARKRMLELNLPDKNQIIVNKLVDSMLKKVHDVEHMLKKMKEDNQSDL